VGYLLKERVMDTKDFMDALERVAPGDRVIHDTYGLGTVVAVEGRTGEHATVDFGSEGVRKLVLAFAPLQKL
jgi:DNA helicase-2/ATP-dependent DNA helicase PcrA